MIEREQDIIDRVSCERDAFSEEWADLEAHPMHGCYVYLLVVALMLFLLMVCCGCSRVQYVEVETVRTEYVSRVDTVERTDSFVDHQQVVVREVDSATMAQYGVRLAEKERAWLVQSERQQREIQRLREVSADTVEIRDTVPVMVPVEVVKEVEKALAWWQKGLMWAGGASVLILAFMIWKRLRPP